MSPARGGGATDTTTQTRSTCVAMSLGDEAEQNYGAHFVRVFFDADRTHGPAQAPAGVAKALGEPVDENDRILIDVLDVGGRGDGTHAW